MRLVAARPGSKPVPDAIRSRLDSVSEAYLRAVVESIAVPRVYRTSENQAVRGMVVDLLSTALACDRATLEVDDAGNVVAGAPQTARILIGAHYDAVPGTPGADDNASAVAVLLALGGVLGPRADVC